MDVYHKVLARINELSDGRDSVDVDIVELLKQEGFFPSLDSIKAHLSTEGWITDSPRPNNVRITHWGMMEARKMSKSSVDAASEIERQAKRLLTESKDFCILIEEYLGKPSSKAMDGVHKKFSDMKAILEKINSTK